MLKEEQDCRARKEPRGWRWWDVEGWLPKAVASGPSLELLTQDQLTSSYSSSSNSAFPPCPNRFVFYRCHTNDCKLKAANPHPFMNCASQKSGVSLTVANIKLSPPSNAVLSGASRGESAALPRLTPRDCLNHPGLCFPHHWCWPSHLPVQGPPTESRSISPSGDLQFNPICSVPKATEGTSTLFLGIQRWTSLGDHTGHRGLPPVAQPPVCYLHKKILKWKHWLEQQEQET